MLGNYRMAGDMQEFTKKPSPQIHFRAELDESVCFFHPTEKNDTYSCNNFDTFKKNSV